MSKTQVDTVKENLPVALLDDLVAAGQEYGEALGQKDMSIPFIQILQELSPQRTKGDPEFIKGADSSMLFNTVTKKLSPTFDDNDNPIVGMRVIPLVYKSSYIEWVPRNKGGGFVTEHSAEVGTSIVTYRNENNQDIIADNSPFGTPGNQLAYTHTHFVFVVDDNGFLEPAVLTMASTQVKPSKDWNALIAALRLPNGAKAPRFYGVWDVKTRRRTNDQGTWYVWEFSKGSDITQLPNAREVLQECKQFVDSIKSGETKADYAKSADVPVSDVSHEGADGVPF